APRDDSAPEQRVVGSLVGVGVTVVLLLSLALGLWAPQVVGVVSGAPGATAVLTARLLRLGAFCFPLVALSAALGAILQARGAFSALSASRVLFNLVSAGV